jgi:MoaA/NifB/PqqE/SkfB family radical SAM enzyme
MLIPKDLTVRELKEECENVKSICKDCKYNGACNGFGVYALKIDSEYPNFIK